MRLEMEDVGGERNVKVRTWAKSVSNAWLE